MVGVAGFLLPGNRIDVLASRKLGERVTTRTLLEDLKVLAVDQTASPEKDKPIVVRCTDGDHHGTTLDLSLRGLLLESTDGWRPVAGHPVRVCIRLDNDACCIEMDGLVAHVDANQIGIRVNGIDIDSAGRLRRMVELYLDDHGLLERELAELVNA